MTAAETLKAEGAANIYNDVFPVTGASDWTPYAEFIKSHAIKGITFYGTPQELAALEAVLTNMNYKLDWIDANTNAYGLRAARRRALRGQIGLRERRVRRRGLLHPERLGGLHARGVHHALLRGRRRLRDLHAGRHLPARAPCARGARASRRRARSAPPTNSARAAARRGPCSIWRGASDEEEVSMIRFDHVGIAARDPRTSAVALAESLGTAAPTPDGADGDMFRVDLEDGSFVLFNPAPEVHLAHVAFHVEPGRFTEVVARLRARAAPFGNDPEDPRNGRTDDPLGGAGRVYFVDENGHLFEVTC